MLLWGVFLVGIEHVVAEVPIRDRWNDTFVELSQNRNLENKNEQRLEHGALKTSDKASSHGYHLILSP